MILNHMALEYTTQSDSADGRGRQQSYAEMVEHVGFLFSSTPHANVATS